MAEAENAAIFICLGQAKAPAQPRVLKGSSGLAISSRLSSERNVFLKSAQDYELRFFDLNHSPKCNLRIYLLSGIRHENSPLWED